MYGWQPLSMHDDFMPVLSIHVSEGVLLFSSDSVIPSIHLVWLESSIPPPWCAVTGEQHVHVTVPDFQSLKNKDMIFHSLWICCGRFIVAETLSHNVYWIALDTLACCFRIAPVDGDDVLSSSVGDSQTLRVHKNGRVKVYDFTFGKEKEILKYESLGHTSSRRKHSSTHTHTHTHTQWKTFVCRVNSTLCVFIIFIITRECKCVFVMCVCVVYVCV
eukprot:GHVR01004175.1.p1 GENE.GHVR01004175.1~~GHVR01004175.1.p1  ORF type:complete len:217 (-),score=65.52 GHVR01004175.1:397-1047(-)